MRDLFPFYVIYDPVHQILFVLSDVAALTGFTLTLVLCISDSYFLSYSRSDSWNLESKSKWYLSFFYLRFLMQLQNLVLSLVFDDFSGLIFGTLLKIFTCGL